MKILKRILKTVIIMFLALAAAANYTIFIFPNKFAPSGLDGICTMIQDVLNINMGYLALVLNIPLLILAFTFLNREFSVNSTIYIITFSLSVILLKYTPVMSFCYRTETGTSLVLAPIAGGTIRGILYAFTLKLNASSGGIDIISATIKKFKPHFNLMNIIFAFNLVVALPSYFVYGFKIEPVILSIIYSFTSSNVSTNIRSKENETVKFEIITSDYEKLCAEISDNLHQTATIVNAQGAYSGTDKKMVICVTEKQKAPFLEDLIIKNNENIVFKSTVSNSVTGVDYK